MRRLLNNLDFHKESYRQITLFKQDRSGLVRTDLIRSGQVETDRDKLVQVRTCKFKTGWNRSGLDNTG